MKNSFNISALAAIALLSFSVAITLTSCRADAQQSSEAPFGQLAGIYKAYFEDLTPLEAKYKKAKTREEKKQIKVEAKALRKVKEPVLKEAIDKFNQTTPLKGKELAFKTSGDLLFTVQNVKITEVKDRVVEFSIQVKIDQDIKDAKGELSQRTNVYFIAVDSKGADIPDTGNWATNHGWIKLSAGTIYDTEGHWNSVRVQNMADFAYINIMTKDEYEKRKSAYNKRKREAKKRN